MYPYNCKRCGKEKFAKYKSWKREFCSKSCANYGKSKGDYEDIICVNCNSTFKLLSSTKKAREVNGNIIKYCSKKCEGESRTIVQIISCKHCNIKFKPSRMSVKYCSKKCVNEYAKLNGTKKKRGYWYENGYKVIYIGDNKGIKEHIMVMEEFIGRKLNSDEVVHHINEIKLDNRLENLRLMTRSEHSKLHRKLDLERGKSLFKSN